MLEGRNCRGIIPLQDCTLCQVLEELRIVRAKPSRVIEVRHCRFSEVLVPIPMPPTMIILGVVESTGARALSDLVACTGSCGGRSCSRIAALHD